MQIDWFTVVAQVINFLVLVWLMKRYLYKPVLDAIDAREARIAAEIAAARDTRAKAAVDLATYQARLEELNQHRAERLAQIAAEADRERDHLLAHARAEADALRAQRAAALRAEALDLRQALRSRVTQGVFHAARKVLTDLASASLQEQLGQVLLQRLADLDPTARALISEALHGDASAVVIRSAFDLPTELRRALLDALRELGPTDITVRFEATPDLITGIEISAHGQKVAWSVADTLTALEQGIDALLQEQQPPSKPTEATDGAPDLASHGEG